MDISFQTKILRYFDLLRQIPTFVGICKFCGQLSFVIIDPSTFHISCPQVFSLMNIKYINKTFTAPANLKLAVINMKQRRNRNHLFTLRYILCLCLGEENPLNNRDSHAKRCNTTNGSWF